MKTKSFVGKCVKNSSVLPEEDLRLFASYMHYTRAQAIKILSEYGRGYIYHNSGIVIKDSEDARIRITRRLPVVVIVGKSGIVIRYTRDDMKRVCIARKRTRERVEDELDAQIQERELEEHRAYRNTMRTFYAGTTNATKKHQGQAKGLAHIGKYERGYEMRLQVWENRTLFAGDRARKYID